MNNLLEIKPNSSTELNEPQQLGYHYVMCGDATNPTDVAQLIGKQKINLVLTDPPYGVGYVESKQGFQTLRHEKVIANDHVQSEEEYQNFMEQWLKLTVPHLAKRNAFYVFNSDKMLFALRRAMDNHKLHFAQLLIWMKQHAVIGRLDYLPQHELIMYGWYGTHRFYKNKDKSVLFCPKPQRSRLHPTTKPVSLLRRLILNNTQVGDVVYDPFGGSGSTLIACEQTQRRCLMMELDPDYYTTILQRFEQHILKYGDQ
ncbi:MAG: site-specific DNA-methyltransferase [Patescibacteria group bacterium]